MTRRSQKILARPEWSMNRAFYKSMGYSDYDLERPLIGIANSWNRVVPGHYNLNQVSEYVKQGIFQAGGTPVEFGVIGRLRRHRPGQRGQPFRAAQPGSDRQCRRNHDSGAPTRRSSAAGLLRQDRAGHADGRRPTGCAGHRDRRRPDAGRLLVRQPGQRRDLDHRGARHAQGRNTQPERLPHT